ncbi:hypothetical protein BGZ79_000124 [Entomortierella chlamydospora]|nr:hypothetical protein BGZ79_000124 [Entomortierella chlamydospora]
MSISTPQTREHARWLSQEYSPWCLLHMLLKNHTNLFSTPLLEELLPPVPPSQLPHSSSLLHPQSHCHSLDTESPLSTPPGARAILSRYLVQRLHFGYYGDKSTISESAVRYLTARARLQFGYFAIRGRAFWNVSSEDLGLQCGGFQGLESHEQEEWDGKTGVQDQHRRQRPHHHQHQQQHQQEPRHQQGQSQGQANDSDPSANKDEDPFSLGFSDATTFIGRLRGRPNSDAKSRESDREEQRKKIIKGNKKCEEREEKLLLMEAVQYIQRSQPDMIHVFMQQLNPAETNSSSSTDPSTVSERQAAATYWTRVALTKLIDVQPDPDDMVSVPSSPFLNRRTDALWMEYLEQPPKAILKLKDLARHTRPHGGMGMVQDDSRLFQIASGIFNDLATHPRKARKPAPTIIDGPFSYSFDVIRELVVEYGFMPLPEDDTDRKMNFSGGIRAATGEAEIFPSDGSHVAKPGQKGEGTSIWYFYEPQRVEVMVGYLMHKAPEVLDLLFQQGFELFVQPHPGHAGLSRALLLQCCMPGCHAMVRHVYQVPSGKSIGTMAQTQVVGTVKNELMGYGNKPKRIEFQQQDFADVLKGLAPVNVETAVPIMLDLGMERTVVQNRLMELLQIPGSLAPIDIESSTLTVLFQNCIPKTGLSTPRRLKSASEVVNLAIQLSFEIQMEPSEAIDLEWKCSFEETLLNLEQENLIVHNHVSDWILASLDPSHAGFRICFDHAVLKALLGVTEWNMAQLMRLRTWTRIQEREARTKNDKARCQWEEVKRQLLIVEHENLDDQDVVMQDQADNRNLIELDIEWTTNDEVTLATSTKVDSLPKGSGTIRVGDDGCLLLDNGHLERNQILFDPENGDPNVLDTNTRVYEFLRKGVVVEERHWVWLAMGLDTISLQGQHVVEMAGYEKLSDGGYIFPVKMACSPEAYQLVWMMALAYVQQSLALDDKDSKVELRCRNGDPSPPLPDGRATSPIPLTPSSPVPQSACSFKIREVQRMLTDRLGEEAGLVVKILSELEVDLEKQV